MLLTSAERKTKRTYALGSILREQGTASLAHQRQTKRWIARWMLLMFFAFATIAAPAQSSPTEVPTPPLTPEPQAPAPELPAPSPPPIPLRALPENIFLDQKNFWTGPLHMNETDWELAVPLVLAGAGLIASDQTIEKHVPTDPSTVSHASTASNAGLGLMIGAGAGLFVLGNLKGNDQQRETGLLSGEAAIDALIDTEVFKYAAGRNRPFTGDVPGRFFVGGDSFPSLHAGVSFAIASVIAHEYPGPLTQILAYGTATGIGIARFAGQKHFASDVVIGSALGWYLGRQVYRTQSRYSEAEMAKYGTFTRGEEFEEPDHKARRVGSVYVPLDSWVYPAIDRLASQGYIRLNFRASRPWTRLEVAALINEADANLKEVENPPAALTDLELELEDEFSFDLGALDGKPNDSLKIESAYTRIVGITGQPLNDSYHFGQTIINNFGRPYQEGFNTYDGFSAYGTTGPFSLYVRGEFQHSPSAPGYPLSVRAAISAADQNPLLPYTPINTIDRFTLLDTYASARAAGWNLSFGKQSIWWGPADGGALIFSDNAEPIYMFRANKTLTELPGIFSWIGKLKVDLFVGKLSGNQFPPRPLIHGEKVTFMPTENWQLSVERTSEFGGVGRPLTPGAVWESYAGIHSSFEYPYNRDPGKRTIGFDFTYKVPHLRDWITLYGDGLLPEANPFNLDNSSNPINAPSRTAVRTGVYLPRLPRLQKLDLHLEAVYTDPPTPRSIRGNYVYWDGFYKDLYTNKGNLIGDWVGREGKGYQAWSNYWFTPRSSVQVNYRHVQVAKDFIPSGESLNDGSVKVQWWIHRDLSLSGSIQYEKWTAPLLAPTPQSNWTSMFEFAFWPKSPIR